MAPMMMDWVYETPHFAVTLAWIPQAFGVSLVWSLMSDVLLYQAMPSNVTWLNYRMALAYPDASLWISDSASEQACRDSVSSAGLEPTAMAEISVTPLAVEKEEAFDRMAMPSNVTWLTYRLALLAYPDLNRSLLPILYHYSVPLVHCRMLARMSSK
jgi:hypothetical protein